MSSAEKALSLREATILARLIVEKLRPFCDRIEIAGSIRRQKAWVNDIEILSIPKSERREREELVQPADLWTAAVYRKVVDVIRDPGYAKTIEEFAVEIVKGRKLHEAKYTQALLEGGVKVDLFTARPETWGYQLVIRTGSAEYSQAILGRGNKLGYRGVDGEWTRFGKPVPVPEEKTVYELLGIPYLMPQMR